MLLTDNRYAHPRKHLKLLPRITLPPTQSVPEHNVGPRRQRLELNWGWR